jgi:hypothetical protein
MCYTSSYCSQSQQQRFVKSTAASNLMFKSITACYIISNFGVLYLISVFSADFNDVLVAYNQLKFVGRILIWRVSVPCIFHVTRTSKRLCNFSKNVTKNTYSPYIFKIGPNKYLELPFQSSFSMVNEIKIKMFDCSLRKQ